MKSATRRRIARAIVAARAEVPIERTLQLAEIVATAARGRAERKHPATRTFQAIRIVINDELGQLRSTLAQSHQRAEAGPGALCVISFHSLEDRIVKAVHARAVVGAGTVSGPAGSCPEAYRPKLKAVGKPIEANGRRDRSQPCAREVHACASRSAL